MSYLTRTLLPGLAAVLCCASAFAADDFPEPGSAIQQEFIEPPAWEEEGGGRVELPAFPDETHLLEFPVDDPSQAFVYGIDPDSVAIGADGVVRYTVVLRSRSGARNVLFEGIRCENLQYKTYAHGLPDDRFQLLRDPVWQELPRSGTGRYRFELFTYYLCDPTHQPLSRHEIIRRLSLPAHAQPHASEFN